METKVCKVCGRELPIENFKTNTRYGRTSVCNECVAKKRMANKEKKSELNTLREQCLAAKDMRLHEFTPRELMIELKRRGYEFTMTYTETKTINSKML